MLKQINENQNITVRVTGNEGMLQSIGSQKVRHDLVTEQQKEYF